jgi:hypothetical protein
MVRFGRRGHAGAAVFGILVVMFGVLFARHRGAGFAQGIAWHGNNSGTGALLQRDGGEVAANPQH